MKYEEILDTLVSKLETVPSVEGAFLSGSLVNQYQDEFSDIDLGITSRNSAKALDSIFSSYHQLMAAVGTPVHSLERGWGHCKMVAALYGKSQFPPIGLEIDFIFSQLRHVSEQMPYAEYKVVFDRNGGLGPALKKLSPIKPSDENKQELVQHLKWYPFYVHDTLKAHKRGDMFQFQSLLEEMRKLVFFAIATHKGKLIYGSKRAYRYLSANERQIIVDSYQTFDRKSIDQLTYLYIEHLQSLQANYAITSSLERLQSALRELL